MTTPTDTTATPTASYWGRLRESWQATVAAWGWPLTVSVMGLFAVAVAFRVIALGRLPGINGDEAWYGLRAVELLGGGDTTWRTPMNNVLNPFYMLPLVVTHALAGPNLAVLRVPAVLGGLLAVGLTYLLMRRLYDRPTAWCAAILMATLPLNLAYSRFGWDASLSVLCTGLMVACGLAGNWWGLALALIPALLAHPTNFFCLPCAGLPLLWHVCQRRRERQQPLYPVFVVLAAAAGLAALAMWWRFGFPTDVLFTAALRRLGTVANWPWLGVLVGGLFSGTTVYRFICGTAGGALAVWVDVGVLVGLLALGIVGGRALWRRGDYAALGCLAGLIPSVIALYLVGGLQVFSPGLERYALFMVAPVLLLVARALGVLLGERRLLMVSLLIGWFFLGSFAVNYFIRLELFNTTGHATFLTGPVEPKAAAWQLICDDLGNNRPAVVWAEAPWLANPLGYLASGNALVRVREVDYEALRHWPTTTTPDVRYYLVTFNPQAANAQMQGTLRPLVRQTWYLRDRSGMPTVTVLRLYH